MKKAMIRFFHKLNANIGLILLVFAIAIVSFLSGIDLQKRITIDALEDKIVGDFLIVQREISDVLRNIERDVPPADFDVVPLRNYSSGIVDALRTDSLKNITSQYPNSVLYLIEFNNVLQRNADISSCVQQYGRLLCEIPVEYESDLDGLLYSIENCLSQSEVQGTSEYDSNGSIVA